MKFVTLLLCVTLLSGCVITTKDLFQAKKECHYKGGIEQIETGIFSNGVLCEDGSFWVIGHESVTKPKFL